MSNNTLIEKHQLITQLNKFVKNLEKDNINDIILDLEKKFLYVKSKRDLILELIKKKISSSELENNEIVKNIEENYKEVKEFSNNLEKNENISTFIQELQTKTDNLIKLIDDFLTTQKSIVISWINKQKEFLEKLKKTTNDTTKDIDTMKNVIENYDIFKKQDELLLKLQDGAKTKKAEQDVITEIKIEDYIKYNKDGLTKINNCQENLINCVSEIEKKFENYDEIKKIWSDGNSISNISENDFKALKELEEVSELIKIKLG